MSFLSWLCADVTEREVREGLVLFYEKHNPRCLANVDAIMFAYQGHWDELFDALSAKYKRIAADEVSVKELLEPISCILSECSTADACNADTTSVKPLLFQSDSVDFSLRDPLEVVREQRGAKCSATFSPNGLYLFSRPASPNVMRMKSVAGAEWQEAVGVSQMALEPNAYSAAATQSGSATPTRTSLSSADALDTSFVPADCGDADPLPISLPIVPTEPMVSSSMITAHDPLTVLRERQRDAAAMTVSSTDALNGSLVVSADCDEVPLPLPLLLSLSLPWPARARNYFCLTSAERLAEHLLAGGPALHCRLFLLICTPLERVSAGRGPAAIEINKAERLPHWEPALAQHVLWNSSPSHDRAGDMQTARLLCEAAGLGVMWRDEVTFADVVAVRMRYFVRRYVFIKRVVLRPFTRLRRDVTRDMMPRASRGAWEVLWFISAVEQMSRAFAELSESGGWGECIHTWQCEEQLQRAVAALDDKNDMDSYEGHHYHYHQNNNVHVDSDDSCDESFNAKEHHYGDTWDEWHNDSDIPFNDHIDVSAEGDPSVQALMTCTALLCLHMDEPFRPFTFADIAATRHCLCTAAISEKELYTRRAIAHAWKSESDALHRCIIDATALITVQQRERQERGAVEVQENSQWLRAVREQCATERALLSAEWSVARRSTPSYMCVGSQPSEAAPTAPVPAPPAPAPAAAEQSQSQWQFSSAPPSGTSQWRRESVNRRLASFFEREAMRQRKSEERRRVEQVAGMLRAGRLNI